MFPAVTGAASHLFPHVLTAVNEHRGPLGVTPRSRILIYASDVHPEPVFMVTY
jgi:hypothetical protein